MSGTELFAGGPPAVHAIALITVVFVEAIVLYVGYGVIEDAIAPAVFGRLRQ